jgi:hypothetical protein
MEAEIVNKVANANIEQIDLLDFVDKTPVQVIDLKDVLWNEFVLKEKDFRLWVKEHDWSKYANQNVQVYCSNDAIIPAWAYMLIVTQLGGAKQIIYGDAAQTKSDLFFANLENWDVSAYTDKIVMVKGCSLIPNPNKAYMVLTKKLMPVAKTVMFGEPCSAVPVYKKAK